MTWGRLHIHPGAAFPDRNTGWGRWWCGQVSKAPGPWSLDTTRLAQALSPGLRVLFGVPLLEGSVKSAGDGGKWCLGHTYPCSPSGSLREREAVCVKSMSTCSWTHLDYMYKYIIHLDNAYWPVKGPVKENSSLKGFSGFKTRKKKIFFLILVWTREGHPLQYSGLENSMDCIVQEVTKSRTRLSNFQYTTWYNIASSSGSGNFKDKWMGELFQGCEY